MITFGALIFIQGASVWFISIFFLNDVTGTQVPALVNAVVLVAVAAMFQPIKHFFDRLTENIFFHYEYHTQEVLAQIGKVIAQHIELEPFTKRTLQIIAKSMQVEYVQICIIDSHAQPIHQFTVGKSPRNDLFTACDKQVYSHVDPVLVSERLSSNSPTYRQLRDVGIAAITKLETANGINGYIFVGNKLGGTALSYKDVNLLTLLAGEIALAVENSLRYEEIKQFSDTLRSRVNQATEELQSSNKKLKQMDQTKDEFISLTSHQLRTPLTTVKGYISMILDGDAGEVNPQQRKLLEEAFNSSQRMVHLISDFLNISRIQTGKFMVELTDVNLADILDEEIEQLQIAAKSRKLTLVYDKPADFPTMLIDEGKIRQVMMNFIDNAIYYSPGDSTITVVLSHTASTVEFKVVDHGIGVPKAEQHKLFAKFSRASNARKQRPDGTGIGLFMAKKVIVALGGAIIFQSEEGKGSTFGFRLNRPSA
jgi:signal transduction histidine kinase